MMRLGPDDGPVVVLALPLFEEANRTRVVAVAMLRSLARLGIAGALPDLPGQGESLVPTQATALSALRGAFAAAVGTIATEGRRVHVAGIRSGALLDALAVAHSRWHLAPQDGALLMRELTRVKQQEVGRGRDMADGWYGEAPQDRPVSIAGNLIAPSLLAELAKAVPSGDPAIPARVVRLESDGRAADLLVAGAPPWRRAEPGKDDALAGTLAADLADWVLTCAAR